MTLRLYAHPFSSYCQKVLIALYENATPFTWRLIGPDDPAPAQELAQLWPLKRFPVLVDGDHTVLEATIIIEYLDLHYPGPVRLLPKDPNAALDVRMLDRVFDNYVMTPMQKMVLNKLRPEVSRDAYGVDEARRTLETTYAWLDQRMADKTWAAADAFSLADCAAGPSLFYAHWAHPITPNFTHLRAYRDRLRCRPSLARVIDEARPWRAFFPLGAPNSD
jgi:glutathione S-transferase